MSYDDRAVASTARVEDQQSGGSRMTYKSILVHLDGSPEGERRIAVAARLAAAFEARLEGVAIVAPLELPQRLRSHPGAKAILTEEYEKSKAAAQALVEEFAAKAKAAGAPGSRARVVEADPVPALVSAARTADLLVLSQPRADDLGPLGGHIAEGAVIEVSRPVVLVPNKGHAETVGARVLVAWKDADASARALADARPILAKAKYVEVLAVDEGGGASAQEALDYLGRHGIKASPVVVQSEDAGEAILHQAKKLDIDLVVMGAFARSRLREMILGGATASVLRNAQSCVFMSH
jgi:nucleotide-binding universal stress UspA family protein